MTDLIRSAKPANHWSDYELTAYNITVSSRSPDEFFSTPDPSLDHIDPAIVNSPSAIVNSPAIINPPPGDANPALSNDAFRFLRCLDNSTGTYPKLFDDCFPEEMLGLLRFTSRLIFAFPRYATPLNICGRTRKSAQANTCLVHHQAFVLLVLVEDNALTLRTKVQARVVAEAIATFQLNNKKREERGLDPLDIMNVPCIIMNRTRPTFFVVPVTTELSDAVIAGQYPAVPTEVLRCATEAAHIQGTVIGMEDIEYRKLVLRRFLAFKEVAESHQERVLEGVTIPVV